MINVVFFAKLRESLGIESIQLDVKGINTVEDILQTLYRHHPSWKGELSQGPLLVAINHDMARLTSPVKAGDEVAFFPPVTGG
ncbi:molybdopterin converting factor subunit 1 [Motilimonas cestriensis]|uniref:Molybdopterin synthase sulfur carrier subunit n=1 Tax=Motilimonas cestriensis TaxID=2742685 RepID=A0ABS8WCH8_9GAMM|nr:molybdopterin converting factor subunit 1 [Motilimonas cestriensis]MCE2595413.1 molybdopterin converting factor subunit 1 [Motilimonas cestriensis]